ncbi:MAG: cytochrome b/b6 domain-containing protein [Thermodesulfobacteriota bacterium]
MRTWHWINAFGFVVLILSGIQIRFPEYVNIFGSYKAAIELHNTAGIVISINFCLWLIYYLFISRTLVKTYVPTTDDIRYGLVRQSIFYFFNYFLGKPNPHHPTPDDKFNPLQKSAYLAIMLIMMPLLILSGIVLLNIGSLSGLVLALGGLKIVVAAHFLLACCLCAFMFTHIYLATLGETPIAHFKPMWYGWEEVHEDKEH